MNRYHLRLFPDQPLALEDIRTIPAAVLRGAIASVAASGCVPGHSHDTGPCQADCRYWSLFGAEAPWRVGAAYAGTDDESGPFPATARTCAVFPGFTSHGGHGVFDVAIRAWLFEGSTPDRLFAPPYSGRCPVCRALLRPPDGLLIRHAEDDFTSTGEIAATIRTTHTTLSRARRRIIGTHTAEGKLVGRGIYFSARLEVAEALDGLLRNTIRAGLWIGARRSRGMGAVRVELAEIAEEEPSLNDRIARFNRAVRAEKRFYSAMDSTYPLDDGDWYFTLDLPDRVIIDYDVTASILPAPLPGTILERAWISTETMGGWHVAAGLPRRPQLAAHGVILYRAPADLSRAEIEHALAVVEEAGIGQERGYGFVRVCDPFHLVVAPV